MAFGFTVFSLLLIARGLDWYSQRNIIETFLVKVTCVGDIDCFPNYEIGYAVEVLSSSFSSLFYISSQMLDKGYAYPQEFPGVPHRSATQLLAASSPRSGNFIEIPSPNYGKTPRVLILPITMTNRWHFHITVT